MKIVLSFIMLGLVSISFGQDSTKTSPKIGTQRVNMTGGQSLPNVTYGTLAGERSKPDVEGKFIIEQYSLQINSSDAKKAIKAVGTTLVISDTIISGTNIDSISYQISDSEIMNTEDYLFRIFGEVPENIPADLPLNIWVHKTDNLDCYGIGQLADGRILIPYNGLLLYLRRY
jgi:hypothetical protein